MAERKFSEHWASPVSNYIVRSPPGHLADVCSACRRIVQAQVPSEVLEVACVEHNEKLVLAVALPTGGAGIVCESSRVVGKPNTYLDSLTGRHFAVDQEAQKCVAGSSEPKEDDRSAAPSSEALARWNAGAFSDGQEGLPVQSALPFKRALEQELGQYLADRFPQPMGGTLPACEGPSGAAVFTYPCKEEGREGSVELRIMLSSRRARQRGYWAGNWASQWRIVFVPGGPEPAQLAGVIEIRTHYAEDGNIHFRRKCAKKANIQGTADTGAWAREICMALRKFEDEFQCETDELCANMGRTTLKSMRRVLPLSKERFDWRPIRHSLVRDMKNADTKGDQGEQLEQHS